MSDPTKFTEDSYEQTLIALMRDELGYQYECGYDVERDPREPYYRAVLRASIARLNPTLPTEAQEEVMKQVTQLADGNMMAGNERFMEMLQGGVTVAVKAELGELKPKATPKAVKTGYFTEQEDEQPHSFVADAQMSWTRHVRAQLIDFEHPEHNDFRVVNQWRVEEFQSKRCDMVVMINGLPLVVIELKSAIAENADIHDAYLQIRNYQQAVPSLFAYNAFNVISDMSETRAGTITAKESRYMEWKTEDGRYETTQVADFRTFFRGIFKKERLLDILQNFICFDKSQGSISKVMTAYHQYYAVNKAVERTYQAVEGNGKIGVFWHTQGSGKSFSMVFTDLSTESASARRLMRFIEKYDIRYLYPGHYWGYNLETPERITDVGNICDGILNGTIVPNMQGERSSLPHIVNLKGVKINYGEGQMR